MVSKRFREKEKKRSEGFSEKKKWWVDDDSSVLALLEDVHWVEKRRIRDLRLIQLVECQN